MPPPRWGRPLAMTCTLLLGLASVVARPAAPPAAAPAPAAPLFADPPGASLPVTRELRYRMAGRIRPLLFWIGRDNVGFARAVWRCDDPDTRAYELLIGTDPRTAPRGLNRWGYIAEEVGIPGGRVMAFMSRSDEDSLEEVEASGGRGGDFRIIRSRTAPGTSTWQISRLQTAGHPTIHDLDALLADVREGAGAATPRQRTVRHETRTGFLTALVELLDAGATTPVPSRGTSGSRGRAVVPYVFGQQLHELRIASTEPTDRPDPSTRRDGESSSWRAASLRRTTFEIATPATGRRTEFQMIHATRGDLAGVPTYVTWQPRWWLRVELFLDEGTSQAAAAAYP